MMLSVAVLHLLHQNQQWCELFAASCFTAHLRLRLVADATSQSDRPKANIKIFEQQLIASVDPQPTEP